MIYNSKKSIGGIQMNKRLIDKLFSDNDRFNHHICECKVKLKNEEFLLLFGLMGQKRGYRHIFGNRLFPKEFREIIMYKTVPTLYNCERYQDDVIFCNVNELKYWGSLFIHYKNKLNFFCSMRDRFEKAVMSSNYAEAEEVLTQVYEKLGYSFWYIEAKLILLDITKGSLASGEFCNDIKVEDDNRIIKIYANILRDKVSLDINQRLFFEKFEENCKILVNKRDRNFINYMSEYFSFSCFKKNVIDEELIRNLLSAASHIPLIDSYVLIEKIMTQSVSEKICNKGELLNNNYLSLIENLAVNIDWIGWKNILVLNGKNEYIELNQEKTDTHSALKLFCEDRLEECSEFCISKLEEYSNNLSLINLLAKCNILSSQYSLIEKIINVLRELYLKQIDDYRFNTLIVRCDIYVRFFSFFSFGNGLYVLMHQEIDPHIVNFKVQYVTSLIYYKFTPSKLVFFLSEDKQLDFMNNYQKKLNELYFCDWQMATYEELRGTIAQRFIMDNVSRKIIGIFKYNHNEIIETYKNFELERLELQDRFFNSIVIKYLFDAYVKNKEYLKAIKVYLDAFFISKVMVRKIDYKKLNSKFTFAVRESLEANLDYCVYINITGLGKNQSEIISENVLDSFKTILRHKKVDRPSKIQWPVDKREKHLVAYFWFNICIRETIGRLLPPFYIQQDIDDERLKIIEMLIQNYEEIGDKRDIECLVEERNKIEKERDLAGINNCLNRGKININTINYRNETNDALVLAVDRGVNCRFISSDGSINEEIFEEFVNTFASVKKNYALEIDRMFSVNIRHGILENEIIRFFKKRKMSSKACDDLNSKKELKSFYSEVYKLIEYVNEEYICVSYKKVSIGISLYFEEEELREEIYRLKNVNTAEDLKNMCVQILNKKLKRELIRIGNEVVDILYKNIDRILNEEIISKKSIYTNMAMRCKETLDYELGKIQDWFSFNQNCVEFYKFGAWIEQLGEDYPYIGIDSNVPDTFMISASRLNDMDILFQNLLLNIFKHSGYEEDDSNLSVVARIEYKKEGENNVVSFYLKNNVSSEKVEKEILEDIEAIKIEKNRKENEDSHLEKGKSGYKKMIRLLNRNYCNKWKLEPVYDPLEREFSVSLHVEYEEVGGEYK